MAINPTTGLPETPEEEQARLQAQFAPFQPAVAPPALGAVAPTPAPPPLATEPLLAASLPPPPEPLGVPLAPEARASFAEPAPPPPPIAKPPAPPPGNNVVPRPAPPLQSELANIQTEQEKVAAQKGDVGIQRAGIEQEAADRQVQQADAAEKRRAELEMATSAEMAKKTAALDAATEKYNSMGIKDFWSNATIAGKEGTNTGARILGAISVALGAIGAAFTDGPNYALDIINKTIDRDYQLQKDRIIKSRDAVDMARFGVDAARQAKADKLLDLANWKASAHDQVAAQVKAMQAKMGIPEAEAEKNALVVDQQAKAFQTRQELTKGVATVANVRADTSLKLAEAEHARAAAKEAKNPAAKPLTEFQAKSADLGGRMLQDERTIEKAGPISEEGLKRLRRQAAVEDYLEKNPGKRAALVAAGQIKTPEQILNDKDRLAYGARKRFASSVLRGDSGAAISLGEYLSFDQQNFGQLGDKEADRTAKQQARQQQIQGKMLGAGPAAQTVQANVNATPTVSAPSTGRRGRVNGKPAIIHPDGTYDLVQ